jgi:hypothetical protein
MGSLTEMRVVPERAKGIYQHKKKDGVHKAHTLPG